MFFNNRQLWKVFRDLWGNRSPLYEYKLSVLFPLNHPPPTPTNAMMSTLHSASCANHQPVKPVTSEPRVTPCSHGNHVDFTFMVRWGGCMWKRLWSFKRCRNMVYPRINEQSDWSSMLKQPVQRVCIQSTEFWFMQFHTRFHVQDKISKIWFDRLTRR